MSVKSTAHWASQNDWQSRQHYDETHDRDGNRALGGPPASTIYDPDYWRQAATRVLRDVHEQRLSAVEGLSRIYNYCLHLANLAESREPPTEAELIAESEHVIVTPHLQEDD